MMTRMASSEEGSNRTISIPTIIRISEARDDFQLSPTVGVTISPMAPPTVFESIDHVNDEM